MKMIASVGILVTIIGGSIAGFYQLDQMGYLPVTQNTLKAHIIVADDRALDRLLKEWYRAKELKDNYTMAQKTVPVWLLDKLADLEKELRKLGWTPSPT